jgi:DNA-binding XRE family transcriptional regulator
MYRRVCDIRSETLLPAASRGAAFFFVPRGRACGTWTVTTADPAAVKHGRSLTQGIDHHIAARMRERRTMLGLTSQQVAGMLGITYQQLYKYEKAVNRISAGRLHVIARALGVAPAYFFEGLDRGAPPARRSSTVSCSSCRAPSPYCPGGSRRRSPRWPACSREWRRPPPPDLAGRRSRGYPGPDT